MALTIGALYLPAMAILSDLYRMNQSTTVSIALCTFNGEAYLPAQWDSILKQTRLPDEVVVCDDASTDSTLTLLRQFAAEAPFPVNIVENAVRLGFNKNFERALSLCTKDLIYICDQDDYWFPEKLGIMTDFMVKNPDTQVAFNNAFVADEDLNNLNELFWLRVRFDEQAQERWNNGEAMEVLLDGARMMGCATVVRKEFVPKFLPIPTDLPGYIYDGCISLVAAAYDSVRFVNQPLQLYRTHNSQQVGVRAAPVPPRIRLRDRFTRGREPKLAPLRSKKEQLEKVLAFLKERVNITTPGMEQVVQKLAHYSMRSNLPDNRLKRLWPVIRDLQRGYYHRYADAATDWYSPYLAALGDLLE